jgi:hypothetical protein
MKERGKEGKKGERARIEEEWKDIALEIDG